MAIEVETEQFAGPFDLLLHLIVREEVDLYEISLVDLVDNFLGEWEAMTQKTDAQGNAVLDLDVGTEFLLIAATLIELKSRRLLPNYDVDDLDDEFALWEERDLLLARLIECKTFKNVATRLDASMDLAALSFPRTAGLDEQFLELTPNLLAGVAPAMVAEAYVRGVTPRPQPIVVTDHVAPIRAHVSDALRYLAVELPRLKRTTFRELTDGLTEVLDIVVRFLGVLELFKEGYVDIEQVENFSELVVVWKGDTESLEEILSGADSYDG
ncbi:MAG: ScpA family protein [Acidimicrobiales bacterium]